MVTKGSQVALVGSTFAIVIGGWLHHIDPGIPWYLTGLSFLSSVLLIWGIKESRPKKLKIKIMAEIKEQLSQIRDGFVQFGSQKLFLYLPIIITVQGLFYAVGWGILRLVLLDRFEFSPFAGSVVIAASSIITVGILYLMNKHAESLSEKKVLVVIAILAGASLLLSTANLGIWGFLVILALYAGEHVLQPFMSEILNYRTRASQRATVLSVASFMRTLPYVLLAPLIGLLSARDKLEYFFIAWTLLMGGAVLFYLSLKKADAKISLTSSKPIAEPRVPEIDVGD